MVLRIRFRSFFGLMLLTGFGLGGCQLPMSVPKQCRAMYLASKAYESYYEDAHRLGQAAVGKYIAANTKEIETNPGIFYSLNSPSGIAQAAQFAERMREKQIEMYEELARDHENFAQQMKTQAQKAKSIWATNSAVGNWQKTLVSFYESRDEYHQISVLVYRKSAMQVRSGENPQGDKAFQSDMEKRSRNIKDNVNDDEGQQVRYQQYEDFKRSCKIGPGVKIQPIGK